MKKKLQELYNQIVKWLPIIFTNILIDLRILGGANDYTKFIILGRSRTGSNFLRGLLSSHSQIVCFGERFRGIDSDSTKEVDVMKTLKNSIWRKYTKGIKAVGFKIFYYHSHKGKNNRLWNYLENDKSIKVIHITRSNMLNTLVSRYKAGVTDKWANKKGSSEKSMSFNIPYEEALQDFKWTANLEKEYRQKFGKHEVFEITYEDLESQTKDKMKDILEFLGVRQENLVPNTYKQRKESLRSSISNYDELKKRFKGTRWESFFEE